MSAEPVRVAAGPSHTHDIHHSAPRLATKGMDASFMDAIKLLRAGHYQTRDLLEDLCDTMLNGSLCALGGMTPFPVQSALRHFPEDFGITARRKAA